MRRAKLAPGSVPAGSFSTATSSQSVPLCFVCDEPIKSHRLSTSLLAGRTQYTHSPLPTKIGGYIGDEFVVVVTPQDALCKHCMALINTMDRLELELRQHRFQLIQHLKTKYKLDGNTTSKPISKFEAVGDYGDDEPDIIEVSDEEWTPHKKQRTDSTKHHRCTLCSATYTNLNMFMAHLSRHKQVEKTRTTSISQSSTVKSSMNITGNPVQVPYFKCGCCSESFSTKESLALHMQLHTGPQLKPKVSAVDKKPAGETMLPAPNSVSLPSVLASTLFEDIEQLSHQEPPVSEGVCSEEQRGRVCLLALLNNGVCSDLSHRVPASISHEESSFTSDESNPKESKCNDGSTISITVSIPNVMNGEQIGKQQLTLPAIPNFSTPSSVLYPVTLSSASVTSASSFAPLSGASCPINNVSDHDNTDKSLSGGLHSDVSSNCLDMPTLSDNCFEDVSKSTCKTSHVSTDTFRDGDMKDSSACTWLGSDSIGNFVSGDTIDMSIISTCRPVQGLDMPSLLDEDLLPNDGKGMKNFEEVPETCLIGNSTSESKLSTNKVGTNVDNVKPLLDQTNNNIHSEMLAVSMGSCNKNLSVGNISPLSVRDPMNSDTCDADSSPNEWIFTHHEKGTSSVSEASNRDVSSVSREWYGKKTEKSFGEPNKSSEVFTLNKSSQHLS